MKNLFDLSGKIAVITGGAGFLGQKHAQAIGEFGGIPVILDLHPTAIDQVVENLRRNYGNEADGFATDITQESQVRETCDHIIRKFGRVDILINNAANNPHVDKTNQLQNTSRLENFPLEQWNRDLAVGLTGSFLCAKYFGTSMAASSGGSIINIASDLALIAPNQNLYKQDNISEQLQTVKPITYSVIKTALLGLTRYLATYWPEKGVRANAICPGGVYNGQGEEFVTRVNALIPMARMARPDELKGAIAFLASDASSYVNGAIIVVDGGRSIW